MCRYSFEVKKPAFADSVINRSIVNTSKSIVNIRFSTGCLVDRLEFVVGKFVQKFNIDESINAAKQIEYTR